MKAKRARSVLVIDDEQLIATALVKHLTMIGYHARAAHSVAEAHAMLEAEPVQITLVDFHLPDGNGAQIVRWAVEKALTDVAFCISGAATPRNVVEAMRAGCLDVIEKPFELDRITQVLESLGNQHVCDIAEWRESYAPEMLGEDEALVEQLRVIRSVADTDATVLVTGESGTGKDLAARAIHQASKRHDKPFVALNCAAIPESLIEAELFGHARGAFTGAVNAREGRIASAHGGTLFLDEIGDMPLAAQAKLLRVLQDRSVTPLGADRSTPADVRVVAATNRSLESMVEAGTFRMDLLFRLSVIRVELPPLRDRHDDILSLARHFISQANLRMGRSVKGLDESAERALLEHAWPGNVRELANTIERAVVIKREGMLCPKDLALRTIGSRRVPSNPAMPSMGPPLNHSATHGSHGSHGSTAPAPPPMMTAPAPPPAASASTPAPETAESLNLRAAIDRVEREMITAALDRSNGNRTEAAALLGLNRTTLVEKMRKLG